MSIFVITYISLSIHLIICSSFTYLFNCKSIPYPHTYICIYNTLINKILSKIMQYLLNFFTIYSISNNMAFFLVYLNLLINSNWGNILKLTIPIKLILFIYLILSNICYFNSLFSSLLIHYNCIIRINSNLKVDIKIEYL